MERRLAGRLARTLTQAHGVKATVLAVPKMEGEYVVGTREFGIFINTPPVIDPALKAYPDYTVALKTKEGTA